MPVHTASQLSHQMQFQGTIGDGLSTPAFCAHGPELMFSFFPQLRPHRILSAISFYWRCLRLVRQQRVSKMQTMLKGAAHLQVPKAAHAGQPRALAPLPVRHNARWVTRAESDKVEKKGDDKGSKKVQKADRKGDTLFFADDTSLTYLDGTLPADYGFDPLGLSDPEGAGGFVNPEWLRYSEVIHARWAMLGAAGCIAPEILASAGVIPQTPADVTWFRTGVIPPAGQYGKYWTDPYTLFYLEVIAFQFAELRRWQDFKKPGCMSEQYFLGFESVLGNTTGNPSYPGGGFFNFAGFGKKGESELKDLQTKEIKNGRLAMVAVFGYGAQAVITHEGPWANLQAHLADPTHNNILTNFGKLW